MNNPVEISKIPEAPVPAASGNILSSVKPPMELPSFVKSVPHSQNETKLEEIEDKKKPVTEHKPHVEAEQFSAAIPLSKSEVVQPDHMNEQMQQTGHDYSPTVDKLGDVMPGSAIFSWMKGAVSSSSILQKVAEKAKSSVDTMITTLDPQMREYLNSGGDIYVVVASDKEVKISPVREAFQDVFGKATAVGVAAQSEVTASQPVGYSSAYAAAKQRIAHIRSTLNEINNNVPVIAIESYLHEAVSERWYDISLLILSQPSLGIELQVQSQGTDVSSTVITALREATPKDYEHIDTGFSVTVGSVMADNLKVPHTKWHEEATGVSRREILLLAAKSLAGSYKKMLLLSADQS